MSEPKPNPFSMSLPIPGLGNMYRFEATACPWWVDCDDEQSQVLFKRRCHMQDKLDEMVEKAHSRAYTRIKRHQSLVTFATYLKSDSIHELDMRVRFSQEHCGEFYSTPTLRATNIDGSGWWLAMAYIPTGTNFKFVWQLAWGDSILASDEVRQSYVAAYPHMHVSTWNGPLALLKLPEDARIPNINPKVLEYGVFPSPEAMPSSLTFLDVIPTGCLEPVPARLYEEDADSDYESDVTPSQASIPAAAAAAPASTKPEGARPKSNPKKTSKEEYEPQPGPSGWVPPRKSRARRFLDRLSERAGKARRALRNLFICGSTRVMD